MRQDVRLYSGTRRPEAKRTTDRGYSRVVRGGVLARLDHGDEADPRHGNSVLSRGRSEEHLDDVVVHLPRRDRGVRSGAE